MKNIAIKENHLYKKVYLKGIKAYGKYTVVYILRDLKASKLKKANPQKEYINRVGLTVTKKVIGKAVVRNRVKRIIRAAYSEIIKNYKIKKGFLVVITARADAIGATSMDIYKEMQKQFKKLEMIFEKTEIKG
jgi:ribonuclease P protein component